MRCKKCGEEKGAEAFAKRSRLRCKACIYAESRKRYAERYAAGRREASKRRHGERLAGRALVLEPTDAAYIAGIIDGEGWIGIHHVGSGGGSSRRPGQYRMCVEVGNTNEAIIQFLHRRLGGSTSFRSAKGAAKAHWKWASSSYVAMFVLDAVLPYLIIKKRQAVLCRRFQRYTQSPSRIVTEKALRVHKRIHDAVRGLNKRGN
jgi:hypothetical protein